MLYILFFLNFNFLSNARAAETCNYSINEQSITSQWTAYKTTKKMPVSGKFTSLHLIGKNSAKSIHSLIEGNTVNIDTFSSNSGNPARDTNILDAFLKKATNHQIIGKILKLKPDSNASKPETGSATLSLTMNSITQEIPVHYSISNEGINEDKIEFSGDLDVLNFKLNDALQSLNKACNELHKGADGVSKTWSEVSFKLSGKINKSCKK